MNYKIIYNKLKEHDIKLTEEKFSTDYLGMSKHYISMCKSRKVDISVRAVLRLSNNLKQLSDLWYQISQACDSRLRDRVITKADHFLELADVCLLYALRSNK